MFVLEFFTGDPRIARPRLEIELFQQHLPGPAHDRPAALRLSRSFPRFCSLPDSGRSAGARVGCSSALRRSGIKTSAVSFCSVPMKEYCRSHSEDGTYILLLF